MAEPLDVARMTLELLKIGVEVNLELEETGEERYNRIIHLFDIHIVQTNYADREEIARGVYSRRKFLGHSWINKS